MEPTRLRKRQLILLQYRQRLKFQSLGIPFPLNKKRNNQQTVQKMINTNACLHKDNKQQLEETAFEENVPDQVETVQSSDNKLFLYFQTKVDQTPQQDCIRKSLSEAIVKLCFNRQNSNSKANKASEIKPGEIMTKIYSEADKKCQIKKHKANKTCGQIQKLYRKSHEYYMQLMKINCLNPETLDEKYCSKTGTFSHEKSETAQKLQNLTRKIDEIKKEINQKENEYQHLCSLQKQSEQEKITFVKLLLKNGYQRIDGIIWILSILAQNNKKLSQNDLRDDLPEKVKKFILLEYQAIGQELEEALVKDKIRRQTLFKSIRTKEKEKQSSKSHSTINTPRSLMNISQTESRKQIYLETKNYIVDWVRKQKWKHQSLKKTTNILQISHFKTARADQLKKLKVSMNRHQFQKAMIYIFGNAKYANESRLGSLSIELTLPGVRKESYNSNCSHSFGGTDDLMSSQTEFNSKSEHVTIKKKNTGRE